jgi:hypothetical protein
MMVISILELEKQIRWSLAASDRRWPLSSFACVMPTSANPSGSCFEAARFVSRLSAETICEPSIHYAGAQQRGFGRRKMADRSIKRRLQRLCGDQAFRIAGPRLTHARASSQRSRHLLGGTSFGAGCANLGGRSRARQHGVRNSAVDAGAVPAGPNSDTQKSELGIAPQVLFNQSRSDAR